jgi:hypothetical protein
MDAQATKSLCAAGSLLIIEGAVCKKDERRLRPLNQLKLIEQVFILQPCL